MKKAFLPILCAITGFAATAQTGSLSQNFDVACAATSGLPNTWAVYNPILGTFPDGAWHCSPTIGISNTPGVTCSGYYNGAYHLDTSFLLTPMMNINGNVDTSYYLRFDSRTTKTIPGGSGGGRRGTKLSLFLAQDTSIVRPAALLYTDIGAAISPIITSDDTTDWVTHQIDITGFRPDGNFYLAFRYTSTDSTGNVWSLDNVTTSTHSIYEKVADVSSNRIPLTVIGESTADRVALSFTSRSAGIYHIVMCDIDGRIIHRDEISVSSGAATCTISGLHLLPGMYMIRLTDGKDYGATKTIVR